MLHCPDSLVGWGARLIGNINRASKSPETSGGRVFESRSGHVTIFAMQYFEDQATLYEWLDFYHVFICSSIYLVGGARNPGPT